MHPDSPATATAAAILISIPTLAAFIFLLRRSLPKGRTFTVCAGSWLVIIGLQCGVAATGFYADFDAIPPRFPLLLLPSFIAIAIFCVLAWGSQRTQRDDVSTLASFQCFRLPLEIFVLHQLYLAGLMPPHMTYEGLNYDVFVGLTALGIGWYASMSNSRRGILLAWNGIGIASLFVIMTVAILSVPAPFQQIGLDQPNLAPAYFPFILLPVFFVPVALWGHVVSLIALRQR
jgi:hypothetical protein